MRLHLTISGIGTALLLALAAGGAARAATAPKPAAGVTPHLIAGDLVPLNDQRLFGLVEIWNGVGFCSGTLLNRFWVLTADHCFRTNPEDPHSRLVELADVQVSAYWSSHPAATPTQIVPFGPDMADDVALIFLGAGDFGPSPSQPLFESRVASRAVIRKYGAGIYAFATPGPPPTAALSDDNYRMGVFRVDPDVSDFTYFLAPNTSGKSAAGGDSGGPDWVIENGVAVGIGGVSSASSVSGYVAGKPHIWDWVTGINLTRSAAIYPARSTILTLINAPFCPGVADACGVAETTSLLIH